MEIALVVAVAYLLSSFVFTFICSLCLPGNNWEDEGSVTALVSLVWPFALFVLVVELIKMHYERWYFPWIMVGKLGTKLRKNYENR